MNKPLSSTAKDKLEELVASGKWTREAVTQKIEPVLQMLTEEEAMQALYEMSFLQCHARALGPCIRGRKVTVI